jgi:hypothetical protein
MNGLCELDVTSGGVINLSTNWRQINPGYPGHRCLRLTGSNMNNAVLVFERPPGGDGIGGSCFSLLTIICDAALPAGNPILIRYADSVGGSIGLGSSTGKHALIGFPESGAPIILWQKA